MVKQTIDTQLKKNYVGCDKESGLSIPNFIKIYKAYGIKSVTLNDNKSIDKNLEYIMKYKKPIMCLVKINKNARIKPKMKLRDPLYDMLLRLGRLDIKNVMLSVRIDE